MSTALKTTNLAVRFILELCMLAAFCYWGFVTGGDILTKILLGIGAPLVAAVIWGLWSAPRPPRRLRDPWRLAVEVVLFGLASAGLFFTGHPVLAEGGSVRASSSTSNLYSRLNVLFDIDIMLPPSFSVSRVRYPIIPRLHFFGGSPP